MFSQNSNTHCVKSVRIWSFSGPHFPAFGLNTERCGVEKLSMNGNDRDCRTTASDLLEKLNEVSFYMNLVFMRNVLYKMKIVTLTL